MRKREVRVDRWDINILEQVAYSCNIAAGCGREGNDDDWKLFLTAVYDAIRVLDDTTRAIVLLHQEFAHNASDISRILNKPESTVKALLRQGVDKMVFYLKNRSMIRKDVFTCKALKLIYSQQPDMEELNEPPQFEFLVGKQQPWFYPRNYLVGAYE